MIRFKFIVFVIILTSLQGFSQNNFVLENRKSDKVYFKLINNIIVIPVDVNGIKLSFVLDTGVSKPILFNFLNIAGDLQINDTEQILLRGIGEGKPIEAVRSSNNVLKIGKAVNFKQDLYAVFDSEINFSPSLGIPIHGIIGHDLFKNFVVEINYTNKYIKLYKPDDFKLKKRYRKNVLPLQFRHKKPYLDAEVYIDSAHVPVKLLIDTGSSDALWLFEDIDSNIKVPSESFDDFLGKSLSGEIYGKRSQVDQFKLSNFELKNVNTAFPNDESIIFAKKIKGRNGSISSEILKRFNLIFDYSDKKMYLRKNGNFKSPFYYNKSGLTVEDSGLHFNEETDMSGNYNFSISKFFTVLNVRPNSPADKAGIQINDQIIRINDVDSSAYNLNDVVNLFFDEEGEEISLLINREGEELAIRFRLEEVLKAKKK